MHKCPNCGQEYEGKFCPNCGAQWQEEKVCPQCGATLNGSARFCNECGYSFVTTQEQVKNKSGFKDKLNLLVAWVKSHLKIVIPVAIALVLVIILSCSIPACIANKTNGTYYELGRDGELDKESYFILKSGKWEDNDGVTGTYKKDGDKITLYVEFLGSEEELCSGIVTDGVLKVKVMGADYVYISENHKHNYGEWETVNEAIEMRMCVCGIKENRTKGLEYTLNDNKKGYTVKGKGTAKTTEIYIPVEYNKLPVTEIGNRAFKDCSELTSITIPNSVTIIENHAFEGCSGLTSITIPDRESISDLHPTISY